ncbi:reverse transcriptase domain-containing protein [Tanacetum coccineum]
MELQGILPSSKCSRAKTKRAEAFKKNCITSFAHISKQVLMEELKEKSLNEKEVLVVVDEEGHTWMTPVYEYLTKEILPEDKKEARSCSMQSSPRSVVAKAIWTGYYWPIMHADARKLFKRVLMMPNPSALSQEIRTKLNPHRRLLWPFLKWGIDIGPGPFTRSAGGQLVKFLFVAPLITSQRIGPLSRLFMEISKEEKKKKKELVWDNIVCRLGLPEEIISDNVKQFYENPFKDWCEKLSIRHCFAFVKHPQTNGLVERSKKSLRERIKARLNERSKDWMGELSHVLWARRTMIKSSNEETPFSLTYNTEAVIPAEIGMPTLRTMEIDLIKNDEALEINLDLIEEKREQAVFQKANSKAKMEMYYNSKVSGTSFKPRDMVYRNNDASHAKDGGKLGPKWEGPYKVTESLGRVAYKLQDCQGNELPRTWNICNLKNCYTHEV